VNVDGSKNKSKLITVAKVFEGSVKAKRFSHIPETQANKSSSKNSLKGSIKDTSHKNYKFPKCSVTAISPYSLSVPFSSGQITKIISEVWEKIDWGEISLSVC